MRLIKLPEVIARTGLSRSRLYEDLGAGNFPRPVKIGERSIAFVEGEVNDWIEAKISARGEAA